MQQKRRRMSGRGDLHFQDIPTKANRILNIIIIAMILIALRCWHLAIVQHEMKIEESRKPQRRVVMEPAARATIRDRFGISLAVNKVRYQAAVLYAQIKQVPTVAWRIDDEGKRVRYFKRREYIHELAEQLGKELGLDPLRLEDQIHSKASLYNHLPFVIKEEISEQEYYRLKMLEKDWLGIQVRRFPKRHYPLDNVGADIIGYLGAINRNEYEHIIQELKSLEESIARLELGEDIALPEGFDTAQAVQERYDALKQKAYSINDYVGKTGIEGYFEEELRGFQGKKTFYSDAKGNFQREQPGSRDAVPGQQFVLTISAELQEFAEELLIKNEEIRRARVTKNGKAALSPKEPWIKGGAIVVMDPTNGEVLAMASYPRFNPNDFIASGDPQVNKKKQANVIRWFETEHYIGDIWDQRRPLQRERFDLKYGISQEEKKIDWNTYLSMILPAESPIIAAFKTYPRLENAVILQRAVDQLLAISGQTSLSVIFELWYPGSGRRLGASAQQRLQQNLQRSRAKVEELKKTIELYTVDMATTFEKILYVDLNRTVVPADRFSEALLAKAGKQSLVSYRESSASMATVSSVVQEMAKELFHELSFKEWRETNQKEFLKEVRAQEKEQKKYAKPFIDYLDQKEKELFREFWIRHKWQLLTTFLMGQSMESHPNENLQPYLDHFLSWRKELAKGAHSTLPWNTAYIHLQQQLLSYDLDLAVEYIQTLRSFEDLDRPLLGRYKHVRSDNKQQYEKHLAAAFYPQYGYGYARSHAYRHATTLGSIFKVVTSYEALIQRFRKLGDVNVSTSKLNPLTIEDKIFRVGQEEYLGHHADGRPIPRHYKGGRLPRSFSSDNGKIDLLAAMERSSNPYFALLAGDHLNEPNDLARAASLFSYGTQTGITLPSEIAGKVPSDLNNNRTGLYAFSIGQHELVVTPLQTAVMLSAIANGGKVYQPKIVKQRIDANHKILPTVSTIRQELFMPDQVRRFILEGMHRVVERSQQFALGSLQAMYRNYPDAIRDFVDIKGQLVGKTSTGESVENIDFDPSHGGRMYNSLWFGGISFDNTGNQSNTFVLRDKFGKPELVVVVYLRFGSYGKDTIPLAAQMIKKWRQIKQTNGLTPHPKIGGEVSWSSSSSYQ